MNDKNTIKEYYIKILELYNNSVNILTALNQSLSSLSPQIVVILQDSNNNIIEQKIPSFLYLENKLEELSNNFENFFDIPKSGDAWFENNSNMYKFHLVKSNSAPQMPNIDNTNISASFMDNTYFKDLVSPKTYLKMNISNLTNNIEKIFVKKYVFYNYSVFNAIQIANVSTNEEYNAILYNFTKGVDYDYYDSIIDLPLKKEIYNSNFKIEEIVSLEGGNPWSEINASNKETLNYKLVLDTLEYNNQEDNSIRFTLKAGDYLSLNGTNNLYYVKQVNTTTNTVIIEESIGHASIQTYVDNDQMFFTIYNNDFSEYEYIQVPLEENQYIAIFIGTIYQNIRSILSNGILLDLSKIYIYDGYGNAILDSNGNKLSYIDYYKIYCKNIGDILAGFSELSNPLLSEYNNVLLDEIQNSDSIKELVELTFTNDNLQVIPINKHLIDDNSTQEIISLHNQKSELNNKLTSINSNIDDLYNTLINTDWSQEISNSQLAIRNKLDEYYSERTQITTQLNNVIDNINTSSVIKYNKDLKYRIRGILDTDMIESYVSSLGKDINIIGIDLQYKYKSLVNTTTSLQSINESTFTDWNQYLANDKERIIEFNDVTSSFTIHWEKQSTTDNIIKWNQVDIPINQNEQVVIKLRYKYNIGQPFINIYTPWSEEKTFVFPDEYKDLVQLSTIMDENQKDTVIAAFNKTLINDGYTEHVTNKIISNSQVFFHMPENIYSGFNTSENNLLSLKDKLGEMSANIQKYIDLIEANSNTKYDVYLEMDANRIELYSGSINKININDNNDSDTFKKKNMRIIIKNSGTFPIKLYSQFPGNTDIKLLEDNRDSYSKSIANYERVPLIINNIMSAQSLGQWVYFRQNNAYTKEDIYLNDDNQKMQDQSNLYGGDLQFEENYNNYMRKDNSQILYPYKDHASFSINVSKNIWQAVKYNKEDNSFVQYTIADKLSDQKSDYTNKTFENFYQYKNVEPGTNLYLMRYEDICYYEDSEKIKLKYLDEFTNISEFQSDGEQALNGSMIDYNGAFLYPNIIHKNNICISGTDSNPNNYIIIEVGKELSIPITLEYCLGNTTNNISNPISSIKKSLYFDIKDSLFIDPKNYMIEVNVNGNYSSMNNYLDNSDILKPEGE